MAELDQDVTRNAWYLGLRRRRAGWVSGEQKEKPATASTLTAARRVQRRLAEGRDSLPLKRFVSEPDSSGSDAIGDPPSLPIPAWAGEPFCHDSIRSHIHPSVYPRVGGGTIGSTGRREDSPRASKYASSLRDCSKSWSLHRCCGVCAV